MAQLATRELDRPLVSADLARTQWEEYQELEEAILTEDDYMWFCEFQEWNQNQGRMRLRKYSYNTRARAEAEVANHDGAVLKKRKVKSATRKMSKFFGLEIPAEEIGMGQIEILHEAGFIVQVERGKYYIITQWLDEKLKTVKASCTVVVRSPSGRTWIGHGGSHRDEGREDFSIAETAFTRGLNRAILDFVGFGEESAEDTPASEPTPEQKEQTPPTINSFIRGPVPDSEHRLEAWKTIQGTITNKVVTPAQVVRWLKEHHDIVMGAGLLDQGEPPSALSTTVLDQLRDGLTHLQQRMEEPAG